MHPLTARRILRYALDARGAGEQIRSSATHVNFDLDRLDDAHVVGLAERYCAAVEAEMAAIAAEAGAANVGAQSCPVEAKDEPRRPDWLIVATHTEEGERTATFDLSLGNRLEAVGDPIYGNLDDAGMLELDLAPGEYLALPLTGQGCRVHVTVGEKTVLPGPIHLQFDRGGDE